MSKDKYSTIPRLSTLYLAFYSRELYREAAKNWKGLCFQYLLLLLTIYWMPEMINIHKTISDFIDNDAPKLVEQMPEITLLNGKASINEPVPFIIRDTDNKKPVAIIDTSGQINSLEGSEAFLLITKERMILKLDQQDSREISLTDFGDRKITKKTVYEGLDFLSTFLIVVSFPFVLFVSFGFHVIQVLLLALIGGHFSKIFGLHLDFRALVRLSVIAFTPAILLETAHAVLNIQYQYSTLLSFIISAGYLYYAIGSNSENTSNAGTR